MNWLERVPWSLLILAAVALAVIPLGESHFVQKWRMLFGGTLRRPLDWFDLVFHTAPLLRLLVKIAFFFRRQ